tara:strand:- start:984 stop:2210 length:1227 start_codon:yes stop_codon:yes gene_type:complete
MKKITAITLSILLIFLVRTAYATCDLTQVKDLERKKDGAVRLFARTGNFEAAILDGSNDCATDDILVDLTQSEKIEYFDFVEKMKLAPARYTAYVSENDTIGILQYEGLAAPLDYYLQSNNIEFPQDQMLKLGGRNTIAVAYSKNTKQIYSNDEIINSNNQTVPTTYEDLLSLAEQLKSSGIEYPISGMFNNDRDLAIMFVNMYLSLGGELFKGPESPKITIRNKIGIKSLEMMKSVVDYSNPEHLTSDSATIEKSWKDGNAAIGLFWASQYNELNSENTSIHMALKLDGGNTPASTIWFKGFTVARYVVEAEAVAAMNTMKYTFDNLADTDHEIWINDMDNNPGASAIMANIDAGTPDFPINPYVSLLVESVGSSIKEFLVDGGKPKSVLKQMEKDYTSLAKELEYR